MPTLVFDGDCAFCTRSVEWIPRRAARQITVTPWQFADLDALGLTAEACTRELQFVDNEKIYGGHRAVAQLLRRSGFVLRTIGRLMETPPISWLAAFVYRKVAENRYRLPGGTAACAMPAAGAAKHPASGTSE
jgi:predicted DCC family thiol-disulfide oxidoreductase YuxK